MSTRTVPGVWPPRSSGCTSRFCVPSCNAGKRGRMDPRNPRQVIPRGVRTCRAVDVVGVRVEMPSNQPIVLLRDAETEKFLPIWIGAVEATAIAFAQQGSSPSGL